MKKIMLLTVASSLLLMGCESDEEKLTKKSLSHWCSQKTFNQMVLGYIQNPKWDTKFSSDGRCFVTVSGEKDVNGVSKNFDVEFQVFMERDFAKITKVFIDKQQVTAGDVFLDIMIDMCKDRD